uniref:Uncharacterized protein n=1 Tax=Cacopsylla melanoneura TaxID=428564 RepID=A0A8D8MEW6_9HEMI
MYFNSFSNVHLFLEMIWCFKILARSSPNSTSIKCLRTSFSSSEIVVDAVAFSVSTSKLCNFPDNCFIFPYTKRVFSCICSMLFSALWIVFFFSFNFSSSI